jgi:hypothetical protein
MVQPVNPPQFGMNIFIKYGIRSPESKNTSSFYDQDYAKEKLDGFLLPHGIHQTATAINKITNYI